jgi:hypothetical protein
MGSKPYRFRGDSSGGQRRGACRTVCRPALVGLLLAIFALLEFVPAFRKVTFAPRYLPAGGFASGFFGGLAGMQGALRSWSGPDSQMNNSSAPAPRSPA